MHPASVQSTGTPSDPISAARQQWRDHGWTAAADGMALVTSMVRVQQLVMEAVDASLRPHQLTFARYEILRLLSFTRAGALPMTRLGSLLQVHPTSVTSAVDRLVKQGFVRRDRHPDDGRVVLATITDTGREVVESATTDLNRGVFESPGLEPDDVLKLTDLLTTMRRAWGDTSASD